MKLSTIFLVGLWLCALRTFGWQDDVAVLLSDEVPNFARHPGLGYLSGASAEVRLGRYLVGEENFGWRGGVGGDVSLLSFGEKLVWHMGLNMETLADDQNDINFRLVQVYYQALTGVKWRLDDGVLYFGYRHRCSHGTDNAEVGRITIRSGLTTSYQWTLNRGRFRLDLKPGINVYLLGQNHDKAAQPKGGAFVSAQALWPIRGPVFAVMGAGLNLELVGSSQRAVYAISDGWNSLRLEPLFASRVAIRLDNQKLKCDFALHFAQNLDSGIKPLARRTSNLSFDVDFMW
ncbi:MAG TPA: hypothetical protein VEL47_07420 [Myxococcota bacterium]|nr:hypothetical protein [Myxococcota bacterium]